MINKFGFDVFNYITSFLVDYKDLLSIKLINKETYSHEYENKEIEIYFHSVVDLPKLEKIIVKHMVLTKLPNVKICIMSDCSIHETLNIDSLHALHIKDCYTYNNPLILTLYTNLRAVYLYNFIVDPDDLVLPNLEYLCIFESDYDDSYVYMFNIERFPKLKYLDLSRIYIDNESASVPLLEYYNGCYQNYNMPSLKYIEWQTELLPEYQFLQLFPNLLSIITYKEPSEPFNKIKLIRPEVSKIARNYYNSYFLLNSK